MAQQNGGRVLRDGQGINSGLSLITASDKALADPGDGESRRLCSGLRETVALATEYLQIHYPARSVRATPGQR